MTATVHLRAESETLALGRYLGERLQPGDAIGLDGPLGSGKTCMAKGLATGLGVTDRVIVKSPAYNLIHEYVADGAVRCVFHVDFYRLPALSFSDMLLFEEVFATPDAVFLVEWASKFLLDLVPWYLSITLSMEKDGRCATIAAAGNKAPYDDVIAKISDYAHACN